MTVGMRFAKYHGTGNDFVMVEDMSDSLALGPRLIAMLCDRRRGVGADGVIRIAPSEEADFFMDYSNANGEVAEMCGNGIRCLGKYVYDRGLTTATEIDVMTRAGRRHLSIETEDAVATRVTVDMGIPSFQRESIPMLGSPTDTFIGQPLEFDGEIMTATGLSMGNPHVVLFLGRRDPSDVDVPRVGPEIETRAEFPNRTNVEFVRVVDGRIRVRVWERGSGETMACGTGACASLVACATAGLTGRVADLDFPGGELRVAWAEDGHVFLTGPAVCVFDGHVDPAWASASAAGGSMPRRDDRGVMTGSGAAAETGASR